MTTPTVDPQNAASSASSTCSPNFELEPRANSTTDLVRSGAGGVSSILRETIETKLAELRADCALKRQIKRNAFGRRWARSARSNAENERDCGPSDKYWDDRQAEAQRKSTAELEGADKALADLISEARPVMGPDWLGNDHGRLCWAEYLGGYPIKHHYCQREEGHEGNHADEWPEKRWACEHPAGSWPQGVTSNREWNERAEAERAGRAAAAEGVPVEACEQSGANSGNDPKLSDRGGWQRMCRGGSSGAQPMTAVAVRCSAWLDVSRLELERTESGEIVAVFGRGIGKTKPISAERHDIA